jgi:hypothetical protein
MLKIHCSQRSLQPNRVNAIRRRQIPHQIARQKFARPRLPHLPPQIFRRHLHMLLLHTRGQLLNARGQLLDERINIFYGDGLSRLEPRAVLDPLPQLHARDLGRRSVLHEVVERDAAVSADPGGGVREGGGDVLAHAVDGDRPRYGSVKEVGSGYFNVLAETVVLYAHILR